MPSSWLRNALCVALIAGAITSARADHSGEQSGSSAGAQTNLRDLFADFVIQGITLARPESGTDHSAHFNAVSGPLLALQRLNEDLGVQLSSFPLSSSAGGFTYTFDPVLGIFTRNTDSFGPVYAERYNAIGKGRLNLGVSFSHYSFDEIDDLQLRDGDLRLVFAHEDTNNDGSSLTNFFEGDLVTAQLFIRMSSTVTAFVATVGATDRLDLGLAIPVVDLQLQLAADAQVLRISTDGTTTHQFENGTDHTSFSQEGHASGLGDVQMRAKYTVRSGDNGGAAVAADVRAPTGEERDLLGAGEWQFRGSFITSGKMGGIYPHLNASYAYATGQGSSEFQHLTGFDWAVSDKVTFAADVQGRYVLDALQVESTTASFQSATSADPNPEVVTTTLPSLGLQEEANRYSVNGLVGVKINVVGNLLLTVNGLIAFDGTGLTDRFTPLMGVDYSF